MTSHSERSQATQERLLEAAVEDLAERGGTLEVASVARRAGVSTGAIYHHFGSKGNLLSALVRDFDARLKAEIDDPGHTGHGGWAQRERARIGRTVAFFYRDRAAGVIAALAREPEVAAAEAPFVEQLVAAAERNLRAAQDSGEVSESIDPGIAAAMIMGGIRHAIFQALTRSERPDPDVLAAELWRLVAAAVHDNTGPVPSITQLRN